MPFDYRSQLEILKKLRSIDLKLHHLEVEREELPQKEADAKSALEATNAKLTQVKTEKENAEGEKKKIEQDLSYWINQIKKREAKLYTISNNREYQAITREISEMKRANKEREEKALVIMENLEVLDPDSKKLEQEASVHEASYAQAKKVSEERLGQLDGEINIANDERQKLITGLEKQIARKYEFIRQRHPEALVVVQNGVCQGCLTKIPPQIFNEMLKFKEFKECPSCRRIIYIEEKKEEAAAEAAPQET